MLQSKSFGKKQFILATLLLATALSAFSAFGDDLTTTPTPSGKLPVDKLKEKYWEKGSDVEVRVVQNRLYSKARKIELGIFVGSIATDPFLSVKNYGASLEYHFNDYWGLAILGWKDSVSNSEALNTLQQLNNTTANTNIPSSFFGLQADFVPLYGKLSLVGKAIIYFDTHVDLGVGKTKTETGTYTSPFVGLGEQIYLSSWSSLSLDYRLVGYREAIDQKSSTAANYGQQIFTRTSLNDTITIGLTFFR